MRYLLPLMVVVSLAAPQPGLAAWDFSQHSIPVEDIQGGGPPRDGIPALFSPDDISAKDADRLLTPGERVLGIRINGVARAYPIRILSWHELVNDEVAGTPYLVSW
jgi:hypothetical protein